MERVIAYELRYVDLLRASVDVVALKYAQQFHGADRAVARALSEAGTPAPEFRVAIGEHRLVPSNGAIGASHVLSVGVPPLHNFTYAEVRRFSARVLTILTREVPDVREVAMTLHGAGYGMDIVESAQQQYLGATDAITGGSYPRGLEAVVIAERLKDRIDAAWDAIEELNADITPPEGWTPTRRYEWPIFPVPPAKESRARSARAIAATVEEVSSGPAEKASVFVAMPYARMMRDIWRFGIRNPVRSLGLVCERVDEQHFTGDVIQQIRKGIENAELIVADLTGQNPNVFLEVGYAWGKDRRVLFIHQNAGGEEPELPFNVRTDVVLFYEDATDLEEKLTKKLKGLGLAS